MLYADVDGDDRSDRFLFRTENVSSSGVLLKGIDTLTPGTVFDFAFRLPSEPRPVEGTAEIVRRANLEREGLEGVGARFVDLREDGLYRLERYITYTKA
jgi:hypothetical protein